MTDLRDDAVLLRERAEQCRALAEAARSVTVRQLLMARAAEWDQKARAVTKRESV